MYRDRYAFGARYFRGEFRGWGYEDFTAAKGNQISSTTATITDNENGTDMSAFTAGQIINTTAVICVLENGAPTAKKPRKTGGVLGLLSEVVRVTGHSGTSVTLTVAPDSSFDCRIYYFYRYQYGAPLDYDIPSKAISSGLFVELQALLITEEEITDGTKSVDFSDVTIGSLNGMLKASAGLVSAATGGTDYLVPLGSSTDEAIVRWDGTSGDIFQDSGVIIEDDNDMKFPVGTMIGWGAGLNPYIQESSGTLNIASNYTIDITSAAATVELNAEGNINLTNTDPAGSMFFRPSDDTDHYIKFSTNGSVPCIESVGANFQIKSANGLIDFDNDNLETSGWLKAQSIEATGEFKAGTCGRNFIPTSDDLFDLGTSSLAWQTIYVNNITPNTTLYMGDSNYREDTYLYGDNLYISSYDIIEISDADWPTGDCQFTIAMGDIYLKAGGKIAFKTYGDTNDYIEMTTVSDVPIISTAGSCNLKITASGGTIDFDNEILKTTGNLTDGTNSLTIANAKTAYDHTSNNGSDHSFIDQDVTSGTAPTFTADNFSDGGSNAIVTTTQETNWDNHIADNTQAHSDYLLNSGNDESSGTITAAGFTTAAGTVSAEQLTSTDDITMAGLLTNTLAAANTAGITCDGDTNAFPYVSGNFTVYDFTRTFDGTPSALPTAGIGFDALTTWDANYTGASVLNGLIRGCYLGANFIGDFTMSSGAPPAKISYLRGTQGTATFSGAFTTSAVWAQQTLELEGAHFEASNTGTHTETSGSLTFNTYGGYFYGFGAPADGGGTPTFNYYGGYFKAVGSAAGTSTAYGGYFTGSGADTNYGIYVAAGESYLANELHLDGDFNHDGTNIGFFSTTPVSQRLKANYNNWAALGDVVDALVALGLFDQA